MGTWSLLGMLALGAVAQAAEPARERPVIAVLPANGPVSAKAVIDAVDVGFESAALLLATVDLIVGRRLDARLSLAERQAAAACDADARCLARLGKQLQAQQVIVARVEPQGSQFRVQLHVVPLAQGFARKRVAFVVSGPAAVEAALTQRETQLFGSARAGVAEESALPDLVPLQQNDVWGSKTVTTTPTAGVDKVAAPHAQQSWWLAAGGFTLGAIAAGGLSGVFAWKYRDAKRSIDAEGPLSTSQLRALALEDQANTARRRTHLSLGFLAASVTGALTCAWWGSRAAALPSLAVATDAASAQWRVAF